MNHPLPSTFHPLECYRQFIKRRVAANIRQAVQQPEDEGTPPLALTSLLCLCVAEVYCDYYAWHQTTDLKRCLSDENAAPLPDLFAALQNVARDHPLTLDQLFEGVVRLTPDGYLGKLGPLCWAVAGGEPFIRPLLESLGLARISDVALILAVLDGCLTALTETQANSKGEESTPWKRS